MLSTLSEAARRGVPIVVANPMKERGLERFKSPQHPTEMLSTQATQLASAYHQVRVGGDSAMLKGIMKALFEADEADQAAGGIGLHHYTFIAAPPFGIDDLRADNHQTAGYDICRGSCT